MCEKLSSAMAATVEGFSSRPMRHSEHHTPWVWGFPKTGGPLQYSMSQKHALAWLGLDEVGRHAFKLFGPNLRRSTESGKQLQVVVRDVAVTVAHSCLRKFLAIPRKRGLSNFPFMSFVTEQFKSKSNLTSGQSGQGSRGPGSRGPGSREPTGSATKNPVKAKVSLQPKKT